MWKSLTLTGRLALAGLAALLVIALIAGVYTSWTGKPKAEARLGKNQTEAAQQSGKDAANTVAGAGEREAAGADLTRTNEQEIRNAEGASDAVRPPVRDAGLAALCRRVAYKDDARCKN